jgi:hypothetical protein
MERDKGRAVAELDHQKGQRKGEMSRTAIYETRTARERRKKKKKKKKQRKGRRRARESAGEETL